MHDLLAGEGEQSLRFVDDDEVRIFEEDAHAGIDALAARDLERAGLDALPAGGSGVPRRAVQSNLFDKLGVWTRAQAMVFARDRGFVP
jgi:hypothetical protein